MGGTFVQKAAVMTEGTVKSFDDAVGKGVIARDGSRDVYVNRAAIKHEGARTLAAGDRVRFQLVEGLNGPCAAAVHRL
jgi:CspA family cold shock protein